ncbi:GSCFA domain-containing protein [Antarctobacter heliothermus]|uniref:GSCFA family protein n=1 Tax=Antarctobacter heliothermus TaxID=74033 RepID=A0A239GEH7_9RHOB|nr:GSCFA domain-containing protein [Antarctobacter heliothermus]SNS67441.1 GSCFA family protein [Antarctobacter heliothermus]
MPYSALPPPAFWKRCRESADFRLDAIYDPKVTLRPGLRVATAGSCFAQNIATYVRASSLSLVEAEPAPALMRADVARRYGYGLFSARYGNVYTARQLRQLLEDAENATLHDAAIWRRGDVWIDALRPNVEPEGFRTEAELCAFRRDHLRRVRAMFDETDVFVFTLGLTECWADRTSGLVFPTAPGVLGGHFDPDRHIFVNQGFADVHEDLTEAITRMRRWNPDLKVLLTVSPVPLTATASGAHILYATTYSKSVLRAVAGEVAALDPDIDYVPSYEIITGPPFGARFYNDNLRTVTAEGVATVMSVFFGAHPDLGGVPRPDKVILDPETDPAPQEDICEEALLEAFAPQETTR